MFEKDPRLFSPEYKSLSPEQKAAVKQEIALSKFLRAFENSIARWERMVYPALVIFGLLGLSGFYLIYNVTTDMHSMAENIDPQMESNLATMSKHMADLSNNISTMTQQIVILVDRIESMETHIEDINGNIEHVTQSVDQMSGNIGEVTTSVQEMNQAIKVMATNTGVMTRDMGRMNESISRPADFLNRFAPW